MSDQLSIPFNEWLENEETQERLDFVMLTMLQAGMPVTLRYGEDGKSYVTCRILDSNLLAAKTGSVMAARIDWGEDAPSEEEENAIASIIKRAIFDGVTEPPDITVHKFPIKSP